MIRRPRIVKIPCDINQQLIEEELPSTIDGGGDIIPTYLQSTHVKEEGSDVIIDTTPLIRLDKSSPGLYAYVISSVCKSEYNTTPNIRVTRLSMACGCHSNRFVGDVWIGRLGYSNDNDGCGLSNVDISISDIHFAVEYSPDLRISIQHEIQQRMKLEVGSVPDWLGYASQKNYHDGASIQQLAVAMTRTDIVCESESSDGDNSSSSASSVENESSENHGNKISEEVKATQDVSLTKTTLCLHCRGPASTLCKDCGGAYFCDEPRKCSTNGWSHKCLCPIWKVYVDRRSELSSFPYLSGWQLPLLQKDCFTSETTYEELLINLGVLSKPTANSSEVRENTQQQQNWWTTELHGWAGGEGQSSKNVNHCNRMSYQEGFALADTTVIPKEQHVTKDDIAHANSTYNTNTNDNNNNSMPIQTDEHGLPILSSWEDYYRLRSLTPSSPICLLVTFPLTIYYAIQRYGIVPLTVSQMLDRPLRIHVVGIEKELNFVDLFKEVGYLIPESINIEMTWIVREDMFPENGNEKQLSLQLTSNLKLSIIGGTYGDSLNPTFDIDGGQPDMVIGMNAGLYAYESWRHVVSYLQHNESILGVFTDYNEHSGMNCASLGGWKSTNSLSINPFRQMRAMPVLCMNLPQFSNGFIYTFNEQELE